jgi:hypothetical protein
MRALVQAAVYSTANACSDALAGNAARCMLGGAQASIAAGARRYPDHCMLRSMQLAFAMCYLAS